MPDINPLPPALRTLATSFLLSLLVWGCGEELLPYEPADTLVQVSPDPKSEIYFSSVWPDDRRLDENGLFSTEDFPEPKPGLFYGMMLRSADRLIDGFGLSSPIYIPFGDAIDLGSLPQSPEESLSSDASLFLVAIDDSKARGQPVPLEWHYNAEASSFLPANVLAVRPVVGFPLYPKTRYALVVTQKVKDAKGKAVGADEVFFRGITGFPEDPELGSRFEKGGDFYSSREHLSMLSEWLDEAGIERTTVAGAAVFRTQGLLDELQKLTKFLEEYPAPTIQNVRRLISSGNFTLYEASYKAPYLLEGKIPYEQEGGGFVYDASGKPVIKKNEEMRLSICVPKGEAPEGGWPVVFVSHGTFGDYMTQLDDDTCQLLSSQGIASFGIDQMLHGPRAEGATSCLVMEVEACFLNVLNAIAGRNILRHAALDHVSLRRAVQKGVDFGDGSKLNTKSFGFWGHSQGGLTGAIYLPLDPSIRGALLSGTGGHLSTTLLVRDEGMLKELAEGPIFLDLEEGEELHQFHPALAVIQTLAEVADPLSYGRYWFKEPSAGAKSVFMTSGAEDEMTPHQTSTALAVAAGVPQQTGGHFDNFEFELAGLERVEGDVQGNQKSGKDKVTAALRQFPDGDHFPIFRDRSAREQIARFFRSLMYEEQAQIPAVE